MTKELVERLHIPFGLVNLCSQCLRQCIKETILHSYASPLSRSCPNSEKVPKDNQDSHLSLRRFVTLRASGVSPGVHHV